MAIPKEQFVTTVNYQLAVEGIACYAVHSTMETPLFSSTWGIPESKLRFILYFYRITKKDFVSPAPASREIIIFSGGNK